MLQTLCDRQNQNFIPRIRIKTRLIYLKIVLSSCSQTWLFKNFSSRLQKQQVTFALLGSGSWESPRCALKGPWMSLIIAWETWQHQFWNVPRVPESQVLSSVLALHSWHSQLCLHYTLGLWLGEFASRACDGSNSDKGQTSLYIFVRSIKKCFITPFYTSAFSS